MNFSNQLLMYVGHLSSPVSLNKAVVVGASWHKNKWFILILSVEFKCNTLEKIISVLYTSTTIFSLPLLVFSLSQLLFLFLTGDLRVNFSETTSFVFYQSLVHFLHSQISLLSDQCIYCRGLLKYVIHSGVEEYTLVANFFTWYDLILAVFFLLYVLSY